MKLLKFYVSIIADDLVELQITREDDTKLNVYKKVVKCQLDDVMNHVHSLEGSWHLILQKAQ